MAARGGGGGGGRAREQGVLHVGVRQQSQISAITMSPIIKRHVRPGTIIITYLPLSNHGFFHEDVNLTPRVKLTPSHSWDIGPTLRGTFDEEFAGYGQI